MKKLVGLLASALLVGCASTAPPALHGEMSAGDKLVHWIPNIVLDFYDTVDLNFGTGKNDYPFGAHAQFTKLLRVGVFDDADLEILGINDALHGEEWEGFSQEEGDYDISLSIGAGAGASASIDLYEVYDWIVGTITLNQVNPSDDHEDLDEDDDD